MKVTRAVPGMLQPFQSFPPLEIAVRIAVAAGCGLLAGLERQWAHKELGSRTFTLVSLLGAVAALISPSFIIAGFAGIVALTVVNSIGNLVRASAAETTTSVAVMVTFGLGVLAGQGHVFTPAAAVILMTLLLSLKPQLSRFAVGLSQQEVRGAVLLGLLGFVIYPVLPARFIDPWRLFNPREVWLTIILISAIGFLNYVMLRLFSARGLYYAAVFGGLINSTAAIAELAAFTRHAKDDARALIVAVNELAVASMMARNLVLLAIFAPAAGILAAAPMLGMAAAAVLVAWRRQRATTPAPVLQLGSPLDFRKAAGFGALFLAIACAGSLAQRMIGSSGIMAVSLIGGLASSASSTAAAATLAAAGRISPREAAICTVLTSIASMAMNRPVLYRELGDRGLARALTLISAGICAAGLVIAAMADIVKSF